MEDAVVRRHCYEIARQILVPARTFTPLASSADIHSYGSSGRSKSGQVDNNNNATTPSVTAASVPLRRAADAVATRAVTLCRLCRAPQHSIPITPRGGGSTSSAGGGVGENGGLGTAAFCVCASIAVLQPNVWESLKWRATAVRARGAPRLLLGGPNPLPFSLKELESFFLRSARVLASPFSRIRQQQQQPSVMNEPSSSATPMEVMSGGPAVSSTVPAQPNAQAVTQKAAASEGGKRSAVTVSMTGVEPIFDEVQAESIAACYFLSVSTPEERKRSPLVFQISEGALKRRREKLRAEQDVNSCGKSDEKVCGRKRHREGGHGAQPATPHQTSTVPTAAAHKDASRDPATASSARASASMDSQHRPSSDPLSAKPGWPRAPFGQSNRVAPAFLYTEESAAASIAAATASRGGGSVGVVRGGGSHLPLCFAGEDLAEEENDNEDPEKGGNDAISDSVSGDDGGHGESDSDGSLAGADVAVARRHREKERKRKRQQREVQKLKKARQRKRVPLRGAQDAADPETLWTRLYAVAVGDGDDDAEESSDIHRRAGEDATPDPSTSSLFSSSRPVHLVELAAEVEVARNRLRWRRLETCLSNPLLFHHELLTRGPQRSTSTFASSPLSEARADAAESLYGGLGSAYASRCHLVCDLVPSPAAAEGEANADVASATVDNGASSCSTGLLHNALLSRRRSAGSHAPLICHPAHFLFPTRAECYIAAASLSSVSGATSDSATAFAPSLLTAPTSLVTGPLLWTRLLICASWLTAYADYVLPVLIGTNDYNRHERKSSETGNDEAAEGHVKRRKRGQEGGGDEHDLERQKLRRQLTAQLLSPVMTATVSFCVSIVKEARQYDTIGCPVCDCLSPAANQQQAQHQEFRALLLQHQQRQQHHPPTRDKAGISSSSPASGLPIAIPTSAAAATPLIQWGTLKEDRKALARSMRTYLAEAAKEEKEAFCNGEEDSGEDNEDGTESDFEAGLDAVERSLSRRWRRFTKAETLAEAKLAFSPTSKTTNRSEEEAVAADGAASIAGTVESGRAHDTFLQVLARRMSAVVDVLSGTQVFSASSSAGVASSHLQRSHRAGGVASWKQHQQLQHTAWTLKRLGYSPCVEKRAHVTEQSNEGGQTQDRDSLPALPLLSLSELAVSTLFAGRPVALWGPLLLPPLPASGPLREGAENDRVNEDDGGGARDDDDRHSETQPQPRHEENRQRRRQRHKLKAQRIALHELLSFQPFVPALVDSDAVLECARCFSFFHQTCVGPVQSDFASGLFLCHTCRLKHGSGAELRISRFS